MITATAEFKVNPEIRGRLLAALQPAADLAAELIADEARRLAPVDTGALAASIEAQPAQVDGDRVSVKIVAAVPYATYVEYGTGIAGQTSAGAGPGPYSPNWPGMRAQPYMRPAIDSTRQDAMSLMGRELKSAL